MRGQRRADGWRSRQLRSEHNRAGKGPKEPSHVASGKIPSRRGRPHRGNQAIESRRGGRGAPPARGNPCQRLYSVVDSWWQTVEIDEIVWLEASLEVARCIEGENACPPYGLGGDDGCPEFMKVLGNPSHPGSGSSDGLEPVSPVTPVPSTSKSSTLG
ncbi:IS1096 element passenger TnpR family protein [Rubrivivax rivuli]|uniref:Plasmid pRiA4b Orf3-like domain-containing protein n=1 Tax=Rubrivivax rivuli TaxID=1862385 RepID=A0A437RIL3_9BURK|nr:hypothetical protein EOE66_08710 [Rubrivivax rivuli]